MIVSNIYIISLTGENKSIFFNINRKNKQKLICSRLYLVIYYISTMATSISSKYSTLLASYATVKAEYETFTQAHPLNPADKPNCFSNSYLHYEYYHLTHYPCVFNPVDYQEGSLARTYVMNYNAQKAWCKENFSKIEYTVRMVNHILKCRDVGLTVEHVVSETFGCTDIDYSQFEDEQFNALSNVNFFEHDCIARMLSIDLPDNDPMSIYTHNARAIIEAIFSIKLDN